jgi:hypothetical protein
MAELIKAVELLEVLAQDPKARMFGLSDPLRCMARALESVGADLERQRADTRAVAAAVLRMHYWPGDPLKPEQFEAIVKLAEGGE